MTSHALRRLHTALEDRAFERLRADVDVALSRIDMLTSRSAARLDEIEAKIAQAAIDRSGGPERS